MAYPQSSLIIKHYAGFGGNFVDSQYLGASYDAGAPHVFQNTLARIYSAQTQFTTLKPLLGMTMGKPNGTMEIESEFYRWRLAGAEEKNARSIESVESSVTPGMNFTTFRVKLDLDYFSKPDVLLPEDNEYPCAIIDGPLQDGTGYVYTLRLQTDKPDAFLDPKYLQPGRQWSKGWTSTASEYNDEFGTQQAAGSFMLENYISFFAQKLTVTDKAMREEGRLGFDFLSTDAAGSTKKVSRFMPYYESKMWETLYRSIETQLVHGKRSKFPGRTGYWVATGSGMREQMKDSWQDYFSGPLTTNLLQDFLMSIFFSREDETNRKVVLMTGSLGRLMFHNAMTRAASGFLNVDTLFQHKIASPTEVPHLAFGAEYTRYYGALGVVVDVVVNPSYDSTTNCKIFHPDYPDMPIDSARMTFLDLGSSEGQNNMMVLKQKDTFRHGYTLGTVGPNGPVQGGMVTALKAGYDRFTEGSAGLFIRDITRCGELIPSFEN